MLTQFWGASGAVLERIATEELNYDYDDMEGELSEEQLQEIEAAGVRPPAAGSSCKRHERNLHWKCGFCYLSNQPQELWLSTFLI